MGTTLHGVVECFCERTEWSREHWEAFAEIEFNKDYALQHALSTFVSGNDRDPAVERNWLYPPYMMKGGFADSITTEQVRRQDIAHNAGWVDVNELESVAAAMAAAHAADPENDAPSCTTLGTIAFMRAMQATFPTVRLVYYHL